MKRWILLGIIIFAFLLRVVDLTNHPAGFTPDEASFGYDAYSLLLTGKDQWGHSWPLVFESFGDGKMPLYTYIAMPFVAVFGLTELAVRFPNAIIGTLGVVAVYLLTLEALKRQRAALIAAFLLSISPWGIAMSRGAFEANLTVFFLPLALYFYLKAKSNTKFFVLVALFAGLNLFTYHSARLVTPLIFGSLIIWDYKSIRKNTWFWTSGVIAMVFLLFAASTYLSGAGNRLGTSSIFSLQGNDQRYLSTLTGSPDFLGRILYNKITFLSSTFLKNYLSYFSPQFLFLNGAAEATYGMIPGKAVLYLGEIVLLIGFLIYTFKNGIKKINWLILWILFSVIPAALTLGPGYAANRALILLPALSIAGGIGSLVFKKIKVLYGVLAIIFFGFIFAIHSYWYLQPALGSKDMLYGMKDIVRIIESEDNYDSIIVSDKLSEPQIYFAFFNKIDPNVFQNESKEWNYKDLNLGWVDQLPQYDLGNIEFRHFVYVDESKDSSGKIFVGQKVDFPEDIVPDYKIMSSTGQDLYWIVKGVSNE